MVEIIEEKIDRKLKKGPKNFLMIVLLIIVFLLGLATGSVSGYYYGKKQKTVSENQSSSQSANEPYSLPASASSSEATEQTYTVQKGDTLFTIGLKFNLPWTKIAEANGLTENSVIKEGQILKIPLGNSGSGESKKFTIDLSLMQQIQAQVDSGQNIWYLDPVSVSKNQVPNTYGITKDDKYTLKTKNTATGTAIVEVIHDTKVYQVNLTQPVRKGDSGIWAVESVSAL